MPDSGTSAHADSSPTSDSASFGSLDADADGVFVAGTDTGVGKTVVTAGLTGCLRRRGVDARAVKPAQTGSPPDDDAGFVAEACDDPAAATCLRRLEPALAPRVAAELEAVDLEYDAILADCRKEVDAAELGVVEGIGGLRVPLAGDAEVIDLVADLGLPTVLVARSGLGTLNHTALSVHALRECGVEVLGVILNRYEAADVAEETNPGELRRMLDLPVATLELFDADDPSTVVPAVSAGLPDALLAGVRSGRTDSDGG